MASWLHKSLGVGVGLGLGGWLQLLFYLVASGVDSTVCILNKKLPVMKVCLRTGQSVGT